MPTASTQKAPRHSGGGMVRRWEDKKPPERVRVESNVIEMVIHFEYGGRNYLKF